jgi:hypothetical protein
VTKRYMECINKRPKVRHICRSKLRQNYTHTFLSCAREIGKLSLASLAAIPIDSLIKFDPGGFVPSSDSPTSIEHTELRSVGS